MPIYAYRCEACGFAKDILQKMSDVPLTDCVSCGKPTFKKQVTAAGFQLKGSGWYATDFRSSGSKPPAESGKPGSTNPAADSSTATSTAPENTPNTTAATPPPSVPPSPGSDSGAKSAP